MIETLLANNAITIIVAIFSLGGIYTLFQYKINSNQEKIKGFDVRISVLEQEKNHIIEVRTNVEWIMRTVNEIKEQLKNLH